MPKDMYEEDDAVVESTFDNHKAIEEERVREKENRKKSKSKKKKKIKRTFYEKIFFNLKRFLILWMLIGFIIALVVVFRNTDLIANNLPSDIRHVLLDPLKNVRL